MFNVLFFMSVIFNRKKGENIFKGERSFKK